MLYNVRWRSIFQFVKSSLSSIIECAHKPLIQNQQLT